MNGVDIVVVAVLGLFAFRGYASGFVHEVLSLLALCAAFLAAFRWTGSLAPRIAESVPGPAFLDTGVAFLILFGLTLTTGRYVVTTVRRMWLQARKSSANRIAGAMFGTFKGAVIVGFTLLVLRGAAPDAYASEDLPEGAASKVVMINAQAEESYLGARLADLTSGTFSALMANAEGQVRSLASGGGVAEGP